MTRLESAMWLLVAFVAGLALPGMAKHVAESPAHASTRAAFHQLHDSLQIDVLREIRQMSAPRVARTREGDKS